MAGQVIGVPPLEQLLYRRELGCPQVAFEIENRVLLELAFLLELLIGLKIVFEDIRITNGCDALLGCFVEQLHKRKFAQLGVERRHGVQKRIESTLEGQA